MEGGPELFQPNDSVSSYPPPPLFILNELSLMSTARFSVLSLITVFLVVTKVHTRQDILSHFIVTFVLTVCSIKGQSCQDK